MPPSPTLRVPALAELDRQLRFVPAHAARLHVQRAESLLPRIDPSVGYPSDWLVFQITGMRSDNVPADVAPGDAILSDLPAFIERISIIAAFNADELRAQGWIALTELAKRWSVSTRTLQRFKRLGLVGRRASLGKRGTAVVLYHPDAAQRVRDLHGPRLTRAAAYTRVPKAQRERLALVADRAERLLKVSPARAARTVAKKTGRSLQTVRRAIAASKPEGAKPSARPLDLHHQRIIERAVRMGVPIKVIAKKWNRTEAGVLRSLLALHARRLRALNLTTAAADRFDADALANNSAESRTILRAPGVGMGLGASCALELNEHIQGVLETGWPDQHIETARARAYCFLLQRARARIATLDPTRPSARLIDDARTDLLHAARIKAELVRGQQMLLLKSVESQIDMSIADLPPAPAAGLFALCIAAIAAAVDRFDPFKGGRLAAPAGIELNRTIARWINGPGVHTLMGLRERRARQAARASPALIPIADWTRRVCTWQTWTELDARIRIAALTGQLTTTDAKFVTARWGLAGEPPVSLAKLAKELGKAFNIVARLEREVLRRGMASVNSTAALPN